MKKYTITSMSKIFSLSPFTDVVVYRIKAVVDIPGRAEAGELGGWIEKEENLSHEGRSWIYGDAVVCQKAVVRDDAIVADRAVISNKAVIAGNASVFGDAMVSCSAVVRDHARVYGAADITDN